MTITPQRIDGADVSHHQSRTLDWRTARQHGLKWAYLKATEGSTYVDDDYAFFRKATKTAGIIPGAYGFARPEDIKGPDADAAEECAFLLATAVPVAGELRPALDLEVRDDPDVNDTPELREWARQWIAECVRLLGVKPVVYTPYDLGDVLDGCVVWRPRYGGTNIEPVFRWDVWQFTNGVYGVPNSCPGLGHVDLNTMRSGLTVADLLIPAKADEPTRVEKARVLLTEALDRAKKPGRKERLRAAIDALPGKKDRDMFTVATADRVCPTVEVECRRLREARQRQPGA